MNYREKLDSLNKRYNPDKLAAVERRMFSEALAYDSDVSKYVFSAMKAVDADYTAKTKQAGETVKNYLTNHLDNVEFEYQGSVMTDTHIKGSSDIDLLTFCTKFEGTEIGKVRNALEYSSNYSYIEMSRLRNFSNNFSRYTGNSIADLLHLRLDCEELLPRQYSIYDISKPKSIKITNQHYHRDVDVVIAAKHKSMQYVLNGEQKVDLGVCIFNKEKLCEEVPDYPFLSISRINQRSLETYGRLKRMIRFLKNVNVDMGISNPLKSFDINAICYDIPIDQYYNLQYQELVRVLWLKMYNLLQNNNYNNLKSVVGDEFVFRNKPEKIRALSDLKNEVWKIYCDLKPNVL